MNAYISIFPLNGVSFYYILLNFSLLNNPVSIGTLIKGVIPVVVGLLAVIFLKESLIGVQITGIVISVAGVFILGCFQPTEVLKPHSMRGSILMIIAVI